VENRPRDGVGEASQKHSDAVGELLSVSDSLLKLTCFMGFNLNALEGHLASRRQHPNVSETDQNQMSPMRCAMSRAEKQRMEEEHLARFKRIRQRLFALRAC